MTEITADECDKLFPVPRKMVEVNKYKLKRIMEEDSKGTALNSDPIIIEAMI